MISASSVVVILPTTCHRTEADEEKGRDGGDRSFSYYIFQLIFIITSHSLWHCYISSSRLIHFEN